MNEEMLKVIIELGLGAVEVFSAREFYERFPESEEVNAQLRQMEQEDYISLLERHGRISLIGVKQKALDYFKDSEEA